MTCVIAFGDQFLGTEEGGPTQGYRFVADHNHAIKFDTAPQAHAFLSTTGPEWARSMARKAQLAVRVLHNGVPLPA